MPLFIRLDRPRLIDRFTVDLHPLPNSRQPIVSVRVEVSLGARPDVEQQAAPARHNPAKVAHDRAGALVSVLRNVAPRSRHRHACLPRIRQQLPGNFVLRRAIVFILPAHGPVHHQQTRLAFPGHRRQTIHVDVLPRWPHLPSVQPQDVHAPIPRHQLLNLVPRELLELLPAVRVPRKIVVGISVLRREIRPPIIG